MRDYALNEAINRDLIGTPWLVRVWRNLSARRDGSRRSR
jgi:hypothetical protein